MEKRRIACIHQPPQRKDKLQTNLHFLTVSEIHLVPCLLQYETANSIVQCNRQETKNKTKTEQYIALPVPQDHTTPPAILFICDMLQGIWEVT